MLWLEQVAFSQVMKLCRLTSATIAQAMEPIQVKPDYAIVGLLAAFPILNAK